MRTVHTILLLFIAAFVAAQNLKSGGKLKPEQAIMDIRHYTITLDVDPEQESINGDTEISFILSAPAKELLFDLVDLLKVEKVWVNKKTQAFAHKNNQVRINTTTEIPAGKTTVKIKYGGKPGIASRPPWTGGFTWTKDSTGNPWIAITCQSEGATIYYPCKDHPADEPNDGADLIITVPKGLYVAGPGLLKKTSSKGDKSTYHWQTNYTINNYSILFNIGKYKVFTRTYNTVNGNKVPMQAYLLEEHAGKAGDILDIFERSARVQEKYFGEYPWVKEKMAICETPHLGMEHQTLNAYGNKFRFTQVGGRDFDWLLHHEFGHEWWGNKVTGIDWADMWIQEGICTYGDHLYTREFEGEAAYLKRMQQTGRNTQNKRPVVQGKDIDTDSTYQPDIYGKGAFFLHTLRYITGDTIFFPTLRQLATDPKYTYDNLVNTDDVEKLFSKASGTNLKPLFDLFLRTTQKLEIGMISKKEGDYNIRLLNIDMALPVDILTDGGIKRIVINKDGVMIQSKILPQVDPGMYYLKKVIIE